MSQMTEIRWHGRAGQGVVTAGELLAEAAMRTGKYFQAFPEYGSERMGAPIKSYTRISAEPIELHCPILEPGMIIIVNDNLIGIENMTEGLAADGIIIINTADDPATIRRKLNFHGGTVWCVNASKIALEELRRDIPSTMMLAVVARAADFVSLESAIEVAKASLGSRLRPEIVQANVRALERAYNECVQG